MTEQNKKTPPTKSEIIAYTAEYADISKKQVDLVLTALENLMEDSLNKNGLFTLPKLLQIKVVEKPATEEREGINPFTREMTIFKAKPARKVIKVSALKRLKNMAL